MTIVLAGFPVAIILAWIYDYRQGRLTTTSDTVSEYSRKTTRRQRIIMQVVGLAISAGLAALLGWWLLSS